MCQPFSPKKYLKTKRTPDFKLGYGDEEMGDDEVVFDTPHVSEYIFIVLYLPLGVNTDVLFRIPFCVDESTSFY